MKSSQGKYYLGLDHIRALAAFMVFSWHFIHIHDNHLAAASFIPLSLLTEGHTGVALFMTLSGYLFAKLLDGRKINYGSFLWNRALRLLPLLLLVVILVGVLGYFQDGLKLKFYSRLIAAGLIKPTLPNGGWSITVEFHFYLLLPLLLYLSGRFKWSLLAFVICAVMLRYFLHLDAGEVQSLAYFTIVGRIDQFVLGIAAYQYRDLFRNRHVIAALALTLFSLFYWYFESRGGFYAWGGYPSKSPVWIILTTVEGLAYGILIAWYDNSFVHSQGRLSRFVALIGTYSYSIYLLHFFFYQKLANFIDTYVADLSNLYLALLFSPIAFMFMVPFGYLSFRFIESPFLRYRTKYIR